MKIKFNIFVVSFVLPPLLLITVLTSIVLYNNFLMDSYRKSVIKNLMNNNEIQIIDIRTHFGILWGNGNKCNAVVFVLFRSVIPLDELLTLFEKPLNVKRPFGNWIKEPDLVRIIDNKFYRIHRNSKNENIADKFYEEEFILKDLLDGNKEKVTGDNNYYILVEDDMENMGFSSYDFRCN